MGRYLLIWNLNQEHTPADPKERGAGYELLIAMIKQDMEKGLTKDWGSFVSEGSGYAVVEGSEVDINKMVEQYAPYVGFKSHSVATLEQAEELIKSLTG